MSENINSYMDSDSFYYSMTHNGKEMRNLLNKSLFLPSNPIGDLELPILGHFYNHMDQVLYTDETRNISKYRVEGFVNENHDKQKLITCTSSRISINFFPGSNDSLFFLRQIQIADNDVLYSSALHYFVDYKWNKERYLIIAYSSIYVGYFIFHSIWIAQNFYNEKFIDAVNIINWILLGFEFYQAAAVGLINHFSHLWNWMDLSGNICLIGYCFMFRNHYDFGDKKFDMEVGDSHRRFMTFLITWGSIAMLLRGIDQLNIFEKTRVMMTMMSQTLFDMSAFLVVLGIMLFIFAQLEMIMNMQALDNNEPNIGNYIVTMYQQLFGENPSPDDLNKDLSLLFLYIISTVIMNVMTLNLLISIIAGTYDRVQSISKATDLKQRASMLEQLETILICFRNKGRHKYLHVLRYSKEDGGGEDGEGDEGEKNDRWEGTMRRVTNRMEKILDLAAAQQHELIEVKKQMMDMTNSYQ